MIEWVEVGAQRAYEKIRDKIITLELAPGALINEQGLSDDLQMGISPVREALKLLIHDDLVIVTSRHGPYVADINIPDLEQLSEMRLSLEPFCAGLAAERADSDDIVILEALRQKQAIISAEDGFRLFDLDHKFHQALVRAAKNKYIIRTLTHFFGLSQRLWHIALPRLDFLSTSVGEHLDLVTAIKEKDAKWAEKIMYNHVQGFYRRIRIVLEAKV